MFHLATNRVIFLHEVTVVPITQSIIDVMNQLAQADKIAGLVVKSKAGQVLYGLQEWIMRTLRQVMKKTVTMKMIQTIPAQAVKTAKSMQPIFIKSPPTRLMNTLQVKQESWPQISVSSTVAWINKHLSMEHNTWSSLKKGIEQFKQRGVDSAKDEMKQLHDRKCFKPVKASTLNSVALQWRLFFYQNLN